MLEDWLEKRTYHYNDYQDILKLLDLKKRRGLTISVGLPTRNVASTIERILRVIKSELMEKYSLIDQLAIIDSHSTDQTISIANELGVEVHFEDEILPTSGIQKGKGEALWKSLAALKGDVICWIDSDIENFDPRFIYGLVGPLLADDGLKFIKAFYRRPLKAGEELEESGGGRVTELVARPLLNIFYPQLAGFNQPLSGEYAGFREVFEQVPFYTGYAVETGLLIDISKKFGLDIMGQVNLEERVHINQTVMALGRMSFAILQAVFEMLQEDGKLTLHQDINQVFRLVDCQHNKCEVKKEEIKVVKRCPIIEVPEYQDAKRRA